MNTRSYILTLVALLSFVGCSTPKAPPFPPASIPAAYSKAMHLAAFDNASTAPDYILVTIREGRSGPESLRCIEAPFLLSALHTELGIPYGSVGTKKLADIARSSFARPVILTTRKAIENVVPRYNAQQLSEARTVLMAASDIERRSYKYINALCGYTQGNNTPTLERDAVAHVLLECGIPCVRGCRGGDLTPNPKRIP